MSKLTLNNIEAGYLSNTAYNANNALIEAAFDNTLSRDGSTPNQMEANIDMNSHRVLNLSAPSTQSDAARLADVTAAIAGLPTLTADMINYSGVGPDAVTLTVEDKLRSVVSVIDYGAAGDGVTDDTFAFQAAHDALPAGGGTIYIPHGRYLLNQTSTSAQFAITKSGVTLCGDGWGTVLVHNATGVVPGNNAVVMISPKNGSISGIQLQNFKIEGPTTNTGAAIFGDSRVLGVLIHDGASAGNISDVLIERVWVTGMETACFGITSFGSNTVRRVKFSNCWATNSRQDGFNAFSGAVFDVTIAGCYAANLDGFGFEMASAGNVFIGNVIRGVGQSGIGMEYNPALGAAYRTLIAHNYISDVSTAAYPSSSGISLGQSQNPINTEILGNSIYRIGGHGIEINLVPRDISIRDNTIIDVGGGGVNTAGIASGAAGTNLVVFGNTIRRVNTASYNLSYGVALAGLGNSTNIVKNNEVSGATIASISAAGPTRVEIPTVLTTAAVGNIGVGEDNLITYTLPENTVMTNSQYLKITAWGTTAANANNKRVRLYFNGAIIADTGALAANNKDWLITATVLRLNSSIMQYSSIGQFNGAAVQTDFATVGGMDYTIANTIKCTGEATANDDVIQSGFLIEFSQP